MKLQLASCLSLLIPSLALPLYARSHSRPAKPQPPGPEYVFALAAANRFLYAWQTGDLEHATVQLSDHIRRSQTASQLEQYISSTKDRAFEIAGGRKIKSGYSFPVVLVTSAGDNSARKFSAIMLVATGKNDWLVDKLP